MWEIREGMSLRDYFAAMAAASLIMSREGPDHYIGEYCATAEEAYRMADEMLRAREQDETKRRVARERHEAKQRGGDQA